MRKIGAIIQARMSSSRLPGKVLTPIADKPLIAHVINRVQQSALLDKVILATSTAPSDDSLAAFASTLCDTYRGSLSDVLARYLGAAQTHGLTHIVRICGDCPCIDASVIDKLIVHYFDNEVDYASNTVTRTYPRGFDCEIFSTEMLSHINTLATADYQRAHVTSYFYEHAKYFRTTQLTMLRDESHYRVTVDTPADLEAVKMLFGALQDKPDFQVADVLHVLKTRPAIAALNQHIQQKALVEG